MRKGHVGEVYKLAVDTPSKITGLTDVQFAVIDMSNGNPVSGSPFSGAEVGATGVYAADWTPAAVGDYLIEVSSAAESVADLSDVVRISENSNEDLSAEIAALENISAADVWASATRTLTDKSGFSLTAAERTAIATAVEGAILNEGDGQAVLNAIVTAIGNTNLSEVSLVAAIRADLERSGGLLELAASGGGKFKILN